MSEPSRSAISVSGCAAPTIASNSPGFTVTSSTPAASAPSRAASSKPCQANTSRASGSER